MLDSNPMFLTKDFQFEASHFLTQYHGKCENLHGHSYKLRVMIDGKVDTNGMVLDFVILKKIVKERVIDKLDHSHLNDLLLNPSAENLALWIWEQLKDFDASVRLHEIQLWETQDSSVIYRGE